jgi:hypothetical protein
MFTHPDLVWAQLKQHESDLIAQADASRLLAAARRSRRARARAGAHGAVGGAGGGGPDNNPVAGTRLAGNLAACAPHVTAPAR